MEVNNSYGITKKFSKRSGTISLREFKAAFSTVVCELELKYDVHYTKAFTFKQLTRYVHYEALNVYEQHSPRILGVTQIPNPTNATTITIALQVALQVAIAHHGTMPNNLDPIPILVNISLQQLIVGTANIPPTINASAFDNRVGKFFQILELEFLVKNSEFFLQFTTFS
jgi:hypothetical protein